MQPEQLEQNQYVNDYTVEQHLGGGAQAQVFMVSKNTKVYAAKVYLTSQNERTQAYNDECYENQVRTLQMVGGGDYLIKMIEYDRNAGVRIQRINGNQQCIRPIIILQFAERDTLFQYISKAHRISLLSSKKIFKTMLKAIKFMDTRSVTHRDIKIENTLFNIQYQVKVGDFGHATISKENNQYLQLQETQDRPRKGTPGYQLPAIVNYEPYTGIQADIYSAAISFFTMVAGAYPYKNFNDPLYNLIRNNKFEKYWAVFAKRIPNYQAVLTNQFKGFMERIFIGSINHNLPTIDDLLQNQWLNNTQQNNEAYKNQMQGIFTAILQNNQNIRRIQNKRIEFFIKQILQVIIKQYAHWGPSTYFSNYYEDFLTYELNSSKLQQSVQKFQTITVNFQPSFLLAWVKDFLNSQFDSQIRKEILQQAEKYSKLSEQAKIKLKSQQLDPQKRKEILQQAEKYSELSEQTKIRLQQIYCFTGSIIPKITEFKVNKKGQVKITFELQFDVQDVEQIEIVGKLIRQKSSKNEKGEQKSIEIGLKWDDQSKNNFYGVVFMRHIDKQIKLLNSAAPKKAKTQKCS